MTEYTSDQIVHSIETALHDGDVSVIPGLLRLLSVQDPLRAGQVLDVIELGMKIHRERQAL